MKGLSYLFFTHVKNNIKELFRHPARLVFALFIVAMLVLVVLSGNLQSMPEYDENGVLIPLTFRPAEELQAMVLVLYAAIFVIGSYRGLSSGASFYSMPDVNLLFPTPISSRRILLYGLMKQMGTSFLLGFFLLFQYAWLHGQYNLTFPGLLLILMGYALVMFCSQLTAMAIYSFTSGSEVRKRAVKGVIIALCLAAALWVLLPLLTAGDHLLASAVASVNAPVLRCFPVAGWAAAFVAGCLEGAALPLGLGLAACLIYVTGFILLITRSRADFYEDVLQATEVSFSAITAKKEGKVTDTPAHIKVGKTGIGKGWGASVFFYKLRLENRRARVLIMDIPSMIFIAFVILFAFIMRNGGPIPILASSVYMMMFSIALGRWLRELTLPYVYMVPVSPFRKLLYLLLDGVCKLALESALMLVPAGLILRLNPAEILFCVLARIGFGLVFMASNILVERLMGASVNRVLIMIVYFLAMLLLCIPGVVLGILLATLAGAVGLAWAAVSVGLLGTVVFNLLVALLLLFCCRNMLNFAELNNK